MYQDPPFLICCSLFYKTSCNYFMGTCHFVIDNLKKLHLYVVDSWNQLLNYLCYSLLFFFLKIGIASFKCLTGSSKDHFRDNIFVMELLSQPWQKFCPCWFYFFFLPLLAFETIPLQKSYKTVLAALGAKIHYIGGIYCIIHLCLEISLCNVQPS